MKQYTQILSSFLCYLVIGNLFCACGGDPETANTNIPTQNNVSPVSQTAVTPPSGIQGVMEVKSTSGDVLIAIDFSQREAVLRYDRGQKTLMSQLKKVGKLSYFNNKGDIVAIVKQKEDGFKLEDSNEQLLWKVKIKDQKIKISDNAENQGAYEIKSNETGKYKLKASDETQLGEVKFKDGKVTVKGRETFEISAPANHPAYAVLLLQDIPEEERMIILSELLRK
ncbi:MAG: hypothetical protein HC880_00940 [Bacteroidia bacterium]|nr:hypothetical protein [Bacteroidia bacterium]